MPRPCQGRSISRIAVSGRSRSSSRVLGSGGWSYANDECWRSHERGHQRENAGLSPHEFLRDRLERVPGRIVDRAGGGVGKPLLGETFARLSALGETSAKL